MVLRLKLTVVVIAIIATNKGFAESNLTKVDFPKNNIILEQGKTKKSLTVEIAQTEQQLAYGLMNRTKLGLNDGMLFIFEDEKIRSFWMKNTLINLSIGYFDKNKKLIDIQEMKAITSVLQLDIPNYTSRGPAKYALEMSEGWFTKNKITTGALLRIK